MRKRSDKVKVILVVGARPNFMKAAPIIQALRKYLDEIEHILVHTGQHYDFVMSQIFFQDLQLPQPDEYLNVGSGTHAEQTARTMIAFDRVVQEVCPKLVIVVGDVNSTLACALVCAKRGVDIAHVEAGVRSFDMAMPEEVNRLLTDQVARILFTPSQDANDNLAREGIPPERIHFVGNVMIDSLMASVAQIERREILTSLDLNGKPYVLITLHRPSNVDNPDHLGVLLDSMAKLANGVAVVFSIHPRTRKRIQEFGFSGHLEQVANLYPIESLGYLDFLALMKSADVVLTDSGGVQAETTFLGVPCVTVRPSTEWLVTLTSGTNQLVDCNQGEIIAVVETLLNNPIQKHSIPTMWDGRTAERIVEVLKQCYGEG
ncbi:MAG: UDP-N-acetylglucosamine 2-epimerase (non-hydrolyzing) [Fidelibacterota bacterium]|nr:MAG: UDP-N-acetylglucosamine 2-epimerase (non-hydrolyzing) [Candidatus Neomarinimicrobiota bacterium]